MKVPCYPVSVKALIRKGDKFFFLIKERNGKIFYGLPGGLKEPGEKLEEALAREVKEETGLIVEPLHLLGANMYIHPTGSENVVLLYSARIIGGELHLTGERDVRFVGYEWLTVEEMREKLKPEDYRRFILDVVRRYKEIP